VLKRRRPSVVEIPHALGGFDGAGGIVATGPHATFAQGGEVMLAGVLGCAGMQAHFVARKPPGLPWDEAAALPPVVGDTRVPFCPRAVRAASPRGNARDRQRRRFCGFTTCSAPKNQLTTWKEPVERNRGTQEWLR
jgi:hypothetical protein